MDASVTNQDQALRRRAQAVVPGGMWGHQNAAGLPPGYPQFFASAEGCLIRDVDGREYIDFMCSWGPIILGHRHPEVEAATRRQLMLGDCMNGPGEAMVELAEMLVARQPHADWAQFQKNGGDATTVAATIARAGTGRRKILTARGAYHGSLPWCSPTLAGVTPEDRAHLLHYTYNDIASVECALDEAGADAAAIIVSAFRHDYALDQELPDTAFAQRVRALCDQSGAALIIDDVRAGFRLDMGGSWAPFGVKPDLACFSKAIANGYPLAAVTGNDRFREAATKVYSTGSFWTGSVAMAAGVATQRALEAENAISAMTESGTMLRDGLAEIAGRRGARIRQTGPVQMPTLLFDDDPEQALGFAFCDAALRRGVYFHPRHNMFLSSAHTPSHIERALEAADGAMAEVLAQRPASLVA